MKLYPWPHPPVEVEPTHNRLVLFSSPRMLHRVTPFRPHPAPAVADGAAAAAGGDDTTAGGGGRCCFTIWLSQSAGMKRAAAAAATSPPSISSLEPTTSPAVDPAAATRFLLHPLVRPHVMKLVSNRQWMYTNCCKLAAW